MQGPENETVSERRRGEQLLGVIPKILRTSDKMGLAESCASRVDGKDF